MAAHHCQRLKVVHCAWLAKTYSLPPAPSRGQGPQLKAALSTMPTHQPWREDIAGKDAYEHQLLPAACSPETAVD